MYLNEEEWILVNNIILKINTISNIEDMKKFFLETFRELVPFDKAAFDSFCPNMKSELTSDTVLVDIEKDYLDQYLNNYKERDYSRWVLFQNKSMVFKDTDMLSDYIREKSEIYQEFLVPMGVHFLGGATMICDGYVLGLINIMRSKNKGDFSQRDLFILEQLNPHLLNRLYQENLKPQDKNNILEKLYIYIQDYNLTSREMEIVELVFEGLHNKEISEKLFISTYTVKKHLSNIFTKLKIKSRTQLINKVLLSKSFSNSGFTEF